MLKKEKICQTIAKKSSKGNLANFHENMKENVNKKPLFLKYKDIFLRKREFPSKTSKNNQRKKERV